MSAEATAWAKAQIRKLDLPRSVERTLLAIAAAHRKGDGLAEITYQDIIGKTRDSKRSAIYAVKVLEAEGLVEKAHQRDRDRQKANAYYLPIYKSQGATTAPSSGCKNETPDRGATTAPSKKSQGATTAPPTRARARGSEPTDCDEISLEEMEQFVWSGLKVVGGRDV